MSRSNEVEMAMREVASSGMLHTSEARALAAEVERLEAHLKGAMQDGGYEYFVFQLRNAQRKAHNAIYVAEQLEKKVEKLEALDELTTNQAKEYLKRAEAAEARVAELEAQNGRLREDRERLDWLDEVNRKINQDHDTEYGWRFGVNHLRAEVSLTDCNLPALDVRAAIDAAKALADTKGTP